MKTFRHAGKAGDLIFAIPTIQALGGGILYMPYDAPEVKGFYNNMEAFLLTQPCIKEVIPYTHHGGYMESLPYGVDYDLDRVRLQPHRGRKFMVQQYFDAFGIKAPVPETWLYSDARYNGLSLVNLTDRHKVEYDWRKIPTGSWFVGTPEEYADFPSYGTHYLPTYDFLALADVIAGCKELYCNQSAALTLAQGFGREYYCTFKRNKTNCRTYGANEHAL